MSHVTYMNDSCHTHIWMSHVTLTYEGGMSHLNMNESCHTVSLHQNLLPLSYLHRIMNESCHTYEGVMSHLHVNESRHTYIWRKHVTLIYAWVMSHTDCAPISTPVVLFASHYEWVTSHGWMSHFTHMNESRLTYKWVMSHIWLSHVTLTYEWVMSHLHMNESCHTYEWVMSHLHMNESCHTYIWMSHVTLTYSWVMSNSSCQTYTWMSHVTLTYEWVMSHKWMSHVTHRVRTNIYCRFHSRTAYDWVMSHWVMSLGHVNDWVMSHTHMHNHVRHVNESSHTYERVMPHTSRRHVTHTNIYFHFLTCTASCRLRHLA